VGWLYLFRRKKLRLCPLQDERVVCDGICKSSDRMCAVYVEMFDLAVNVWGVPFR